MDEGIQIHHWLASAQYDIDSAFALVEEYRFGYSMALCGACLKKILNALWIHQYHEHPPRNVSLLHLSKRLDLELSKDQVELLATFALFKLEAEDIGRWKTRRRAIDGEYVEKHLILAERFIEWLKPLLKK